MCIRDRYAGLLIKTGKGALAFDLLERKYGTLRVMMFCRTVPEFRDPQDNRLFREYREKTAGIEKSLAEISRLLEAGEAPDSEKLKKENEKLEVLWRETGAFIDETVRKRPLTGSYMTVNTAAPGPGEAFFRFFIHEGEVYGWAVTREKREFKKLGTAGEASPAGEIEKLYAGHADKRRVTVLDEHFLFLWNNPGLKPALSGTMLAPSMERARYLTGKKETALSSVFYSGKGLRERLAGGEKYGSLLVSEGDGQGKNLRLYDMVARTADRDAAMRLFKGEMRPAVFIGEYKNGDIAGLRMFMEAGLYAGVKSMVLHGGIDPAGLAGLVRRMMGETGLRAPASSGETTVLRIGDAERLVPARYGKEGQAVGNVFKLFDLAFREGNLAEASIFLEKWKEMASTAPGTGTRYSLLRALMEHATGNKSAALEMAEKARQLSAGQADGVHAEALSLKLYLLLSAGRLKEVQESMDREGSALDGTMDSAIYRTVLSVAKGEEDGAPETDGLKPLINRDLLLLLLADYYGLAGMEDKERAAVKGLTFDYPLPERELCRAVVAGAVIPERFRTERSIGLAGIIDGRADLESLLKASARLAEKRGRYDDVSGLPVLAAVRALVKKSRFDQVDALLGLFDLDQLHRAGQWADTVSLGLMMEAIYSAEEKNGDSLNTIARALSSLGDREIAVVRKHLLFRQASIIASLDRYHEAYETAGAGVKLLAPKDRALGIEYGLLLAECEISLGRFDEAAARMDLLEKSAMGDEYLYALFMLKARLETAKVLKKKQATEGEWGQIEKHVRSGLEVLDRSPEGLVKYNRLGLVFQSVDFLISYKMSRGDYLDALVYAEVKKQLSLRAAFPGARQDYAVPDGARKEFKSLKDRLAGGGRFVELLNAYPGLQANALVAMVPAGIFQKKIPDDAVVLYLVRNGNDVLAWVIARQFIEPLRLKDAYRRAAQASLAYRDALATFKNTVAVSRELHSVFGPLERFYRGRGTVILCVDGPLEKVPFEIMGTSSMLEESHRVVYLSSMLSALRNYRAGETRVSLLEAEEDRLYGDLEVMAMKQLGIPLAGVAAIGSNLGHVLPALRYDPMNRRLLVKNRPFTDAVRGASALYFSSVGLSGALSFGDISLYGSLLGVRGAVYNDTDIRDVNGALFVDGYYEALKGGKGLSAAFGSGKTRMREKKRFSYPAYWTGMRLYLNGL